MRIKLKQKKHQPVLPDPPIPTRLKGDPVEPKVINETGELEGDEMDLDDEEEEEDDNDDEDDDDDDDDDDGEEEDEEDEEEETGGQVGRNDILSSFHQIKSNKIVLSIVCPA